MNFGCFVHSYSEGYNKLAELRFKELQGVQPSKAEYKEILSYSTTLKLAESSPEASNKGKQSTFGSLSSDADLCPDFPTAVSDGDESVSRIRQIAAKADNISKTIAIRDFGAVTPSAVLQSSVAKTSVRRMNLEPPPNNHLQPRSSTQSAARTTPSLNDDGTPSNKRGAKNRRFYADLKRRAAKQGCGVRKATKAKVLVDVKTRTAGSEE